MVSIPALEVRVSSVCVPVGEIAYSIQFRAANLRLRLGYHSKIERKSD
jgi:hypothetical protein